MTIAGKTFTVNQSGGKADLVGVWGSGVWAYMNNSSWSRITSARPVENTMATGDLDGNGKAELVGVFSSGVWAWMNNGRWIRLTTAIPSANTMVTGNLDGN